MKISEARVIVTCPDRNFVTLKIVTDDGVTGVGDATLNGRELAVAAYLQRVAGRVVGDPVRGVGADVLDTEHVDQQLGELVRTPGRPWTCGVRWPAWR